jgi:hypothetical protein
MCSLGAKRQAAPFSIRALRVPTPASGAQARAGVGAARVARRPRSRRRGRRGALAGAVRGVRRGGRQARHRAVPGRSPAGATARDRLPRPRRPVSPVGAPRPGAPRPPDLDGHRRRRLAGGPARAGLTRACSCATGGRRTASPRRRRTRRASPICCAASPSCSRRCSGGRRASLPARRAPALGTALTLRGRPSTRSGPPSSPARSAAAPARRMVPPRGTSWPASCARRGRNRVIRWISSWRSSGVRAPSSPTSSPRSRPALISTPRRQAPTRDDPCCLGPDWAGPARGDVRPVARSTGCPPPHTTRDGARTPPAGDGRGGGRGTPGRSLSPPRSDFRASRRPRSWCG